MPLRWLITGVAASVVGVVGLPASLPFTGSFAIAPAIAQSPPVSNEEIDQYARAVLEMDPYRSEAYTQIKDLLLQAGMDISDINMTCSDSQDISNVPRSIRRQVREILVNYCNQAQEIVEGNGLNPRRFNEITQAHQEDETLFERIQQALIRLQQ